MGTHVYLWQIHFYILQNQYNIVKLNKIKLKELNYINFKLHQNQRINGQDPSPLNMFIMFYYHLCYWDYPHLLHPYGGNALYATSFANSIVGADLHDRNHQTL